MNHNAHIWLSIAFSVGLGLLIWKLNLVSMIVYSIPMYATANLPDFIEPAINWNHRRYFHSKRFFKFLTACLFISLLYSSFKEPKYFFLFFSILGYQLHMIADAVTWKGMPN